MIPEYDNAARAWVAVQIGIALRDCPPNLASARLRGLVARELRHDDLPEPILTWPPQSPYGYVSLSEHVDKIEYWIGQSESWQRCAAKWRRLALWSVPVCAWLVGLAAWGWAR